MGVWDSICVENLSRACCHVFQAF